METTPVGYTQRLTVLCEDAQIGLDQVGFPNSTANHLSFTLVSKTGAYIFLFEPLSKVSEWGEFSYALDFKSNKVSSIIRTEDGDGNDFHPITLSVALIGILGRAERTVLGCALEAPGVRDNEPAKEMLYGRKSRKRLRRIRQSSIKTKMTPGAEPAPQRRPTASPGHKSEGRKRNEREQKEKSVRSKSAKKTSSRMRRRASKAKDAPADQETVRKGRKRTPKSSGASLHACETVVKTAPEWRRRDAPLEDARITKGKSGLHVFASSTKTPRLLSPPYAQSPPNETKEKRQGGSRRSTNLAASTKPSDELGEGKRDEGTAYPLACNGGGQT
ncbi:hypothetical protein DFH09DRAFT_1069436 [Mycena vulgaris]|nr:hypothetical protein DFH09DRAFT_1069436 [Mycena vulgaris]